MSAQPPPPTESKRETLLAQRERELREAKTQHAYNETISRNAHQHVARVSGELRRLEARAREASTLKDAQALEPELAETRRGVELAERFAAARHAAFEQSREALARAGTDLRDAQALAQGLRAAIERQQRTIAQLQAVEPERERDLEASRMVREDAERRLASLYRQLSEVSGEATT